MNISVSEIKSSLNKLGLSTSTPGVIGQDRFDELQSRLDSAKGKTTAALGVLAKMPNSDSNDAKSIQLRGKMQMQENSQFEIPSLAELSISEIRSRLTTLGENTNTPGLSGEERREELKRRLVGAICAGPDGEEINNMLDELVEKEEMKNEVENVKLKKGLDFSNDLSIPVNAINNDISVESKISIETSINSIEDKDEDEDEEQKEDEQPLSQAQISQIKRDLKRISNKRAMLIAGRLSGIGQDSDLKEREKVLTQADAEIARLSVQKQKSKSLSKEKASSVIVDGGQSMPIEKVLFELEEKKKNAKNDIKLLRQRVREEADFDSEYGIAIEEDLKKILSYALSNKSRLRKKITEIKTTRGVDDAAHDSKSSKQKMNKRGDRFESKIEKLEADSERAMSGLDDLLAEMELEEEAAKNESDILFENDMIKNLNTKKSKNHSTNSRSNALNSENNKRNSQMKEQEQEVKDIELIRKTVCDTIPNNHNDRDGNDNYEDEDSENIDDEIKPTDSPLKLSLPLSGSLLSALIEAPSDKLPSIIRTSPDETNFATGIALRIGKTFDGAKDEIVDDSKIEMESNKEKDVYASGAAPPSLLEDDDEDDEELNSLLRKYPNKEEEEEEEETNLDNKNDTSDDSDDSGDSDDSDDSDDKLGVSILRKEHDINRTTSALPKSEEMTIDFEKPILSAIVPLKKENEIENSPLQKKSKIEMDSNSEQVENKISASFKLQKATENNDSDAEDGENSDESDEDGDTNVQLAALRKHARVLERLGDLKGTEEMYGRCLELDPIDIKSLQGYAAFLHTKKGELERAESFFIRGIQVCLPGFASEKLTQGNNNNNNNNTKIESTSTITVKLKAPSKPPVGSVPSQGENGMRMNLVIRLLLTFGNFVRRAKGDVTNAILSYRKAIELAPKNAECLATLAHFLSEEGDKKSLDEAMELFSKAMKCDPNNALHALWYARLLKKCSKTGQADLMYQVALSKSKGNLKLEPSAICNYATFIYRKRKNIVLAKEYFVKGLEQFPEHKGLVKNYTLLLKSNPSLGNYKNVRKIGSNNKLSKKRSQILAASVANIDTQGQLNIDQVVNNP